MEKKEKKIQVNHSAYSSEKSDLNKNLGQVL